MTHASPLGYSLVEGVATLTLQNSRGPNTLSSELQRGLLAELVRLREDRAVRAVLLTGAGKAFCVGADLEAMNRPEASGASLGESTAAWMAELTNPIVMALRDMPVPVLCAVNGATAGAGVGLALAADIVLMARSSYFYLPFIPRLGIVPDMGTTWFLPRGIGRARAMGLTLLGDRLPAERAVQWGLAWACCDDEHLQRDAGALARRLAALPPGGALEARAAYDASERNDLEGQLEYERRRQRELLDREAFGEGVCAFLEKREPAFKARE